MPNLEKYFRNLLATKTNGDLGLDIPPLDYALALKLKSRINNIKLYAHRYSFYLNCQYGDYGVKDLLDFAYMNNLAGIGVHICAFDKYLDQPSNAELLEIKHYCESLGLTINLDISSIEPQDFLRAITLAKILNSKNIRLYIREAGFISDILDKSVARLKEFAAIAAKDSIGLLLEPHEDLKSEEIMAVIHRVNQDNLHALFDFGNMINAGDKPLVALKTMAPGIRHVHIKGVKVINDGTGFAHRGVAEREDDLPQYKMMFDLLMLGDEKPQVEAFCLEESIGYYAPAYRFENEDDNPHLPEREPSSTPLDQSIPLSRLLLNERREAQRQAEFVQSLLAKLLTIAEIQLSNSK